MTLKCPVREKFSRLTPHVSRLTGTASRLTVTVVLCLTLAACGFHLRGQATLPFETMYISGSQAFSTQLARALRTGSGTRIVSSAKEAQVTLQISNEQYERVILSLSGSGRVRELQLRYRVSYRLTDRDNQELAPTSEVQLKRDITYSDTDVLGKEQEEALLNRDMRNDAVQQVVRRLQVARLDVVSKDAKPKATP
jgi:LPS-assembly lipoprotein